MEPWCSWVFDKLFFFLIFNLFNLRAPVGPVLLLLNFLKQFRNVPRICGGEQYYLG